MPIGKKLAKELARNHEDAQRFLNAMRPVWEQYKPAERGVPHWLVARDTFHFNDGWGQTRVELVNAMPGLFHLSIQHIQQFDDDPSRLERVVREMVLGPAQILALGEFIAKHKAEIEREAIDERSNTSGE